MLSLLINKIKFKKRKKISIIHLGSEDSEWIESLHGFGIFRDESMKKTDHRNILATVQWVPNKHHSLSS